ncbi:ankyrin repeat protein [Acanthamoeba polyphaga moumouvirus]|uniref:Ankyrin repeat protein n=2 Tax=Moumouvirus TaxID=3080801 RepID=L7RDA4_9VIRU|nr:ankyrin repeat protein [Acanthamoeba polyphaga moumouvirus]AEX62392.1 putative ankyrin repeat protein [Moumouvirus Monve]AGC02266.1 ankyrin repeat protein [Acanthamoeba polyphaga moumouvirus]
MNKYVYTCFCPDEILKSLNSDGIYVLECQFETLFISTLDNIKHFYDNGTYAIIVELPIENPNLYVYCHNDNIYIETNMFKVIKVYSLYELSTYEELGLDIHDNKFIMQHASLEGNFKFMEMSLDMNLNLDYLENIIDTASEKNNLDVLKWWIKSGLPLKYTEKAINNASINNHIEILNFWLNSNLPLKYSYEALDEAFSDTKINTVYILEWWVNSNLPLKYTHKLIDNLCAHGEIDILNWWVKSGLELKYTSNAIDFASAYNHINILNWWIDSGLELKYTSDAIDSASYNSNISILDWWLKSGLELKYTTKALDYLSHFGLNSTIINILNWWKKSGLEIKYSKIFLNGKGHDINILNAMLDLKIPLKYSKKCMDELIRTKICAQDIINIIKWWMDNNLKLKYSHKFIDAMFDKKYIPVLDWLDSINFEFKYSSDAIDSTNHLEIINWWFNHHYPLKYTNMSIDNAFRRGDINMLNVWLRSGNELKFSKPIMVRYNDKVQKSIDWWLASGLPKEAILFS